MRLAPVTPHDPHRSPCRADRGGDREHRCMRRARPRADIARPGARPVHRARPGRPDAAPATDPGRHRDVRGPARLVTQPARSHRLARCPCQSGTERRGHTCRADTTHARTDRHDPYPGTRFRRGRRAGRAEHQRGGPANRASPGARTVIAARTGALATSSTGDDRATGTRHDRATGTRHDCATGTGHATGTRHDRATGSGHAAGPPTVRGSG
jgi:hypothetical protein